MNKRSFGSYFTELLIVIIGVTVAFYISTLSEKEKEKEIRKNYFTELIEDIEADQKELEFVIKKNSEKQDHLVNSLKFYENPILFKDSIMEAAFLVGNYTFFEPDNITYQSIVASGDFKIIHNKEIKKGLVQLYSTYSNIQKIQDGFLNALDENYFPLLVKNVDYSTGELQNPSFVTNIQVKNYIMYTINDLGTHLQWYAIAKQRSESIKSALQMALKELDKN